MPRDLTHPPRFAHNNTTASLVDLPRAPPFVHGTCFVQTGNADAIRVLVDAERIAARVAARVAPAFVQNVSAAGAGRSLSRNRRTGRPVSNCPNRTNLEAKDRFSRTPLAWAVHQNHVDAVRAISYLNHI